MKTETPAPSENQRRSRNPRRVLIFIVALSMALFHMYTAGFRPLPGVQQRAIHLSFVLTLIFLMFPFRAKTDSSEEGVVAEEYRGLSTIDIIFLALSFFPGIYVLIEYEALSFRMGMPNFLDTFCAVFTIILVLETTRRMIGWAVPIICFVGFLYLLVGAHLPQVIAHTGVTIEYAANFLLYSTDGILGPALSVSATVIVVFILFGAFLQTSGAGRLFMDSGMAVFGKYRGGPAKASVMADCLFGMITGSQVANVGAVGTLTIPLMKKAGYRADVAGAIEATGATGAMIMPPVMGATAFIIPEIIGGTYFDVCKAAIIPALLFYTALLVVVELQAAKSGLQRLSRSQLPKIGQVFRERAHMFLPVLVLIYFMVVRATSPSRAGFWAILACIVVAWFRKLTREGMHVRGIAISLEQGAKGTLIVAACCASAGIITGTIAVTGLGDRFSEVLLNVAGGNVILLLVLTMLAALVLGLPLPPVTCYLILAVLAGPALVKCGINPMAAHLFIFFFGTLGNISPPVAPTSFAAAGIAKADPMRTTNLAFIFSFPAWLVPYLFVYSNEILLMGSPVMIFVRVLTSFVAISCMAIGLQGYLFDRLRVITQIGFFVAGLMLIYPSWVSDILGYTLLTVTVSLHIITVRARRALATEVEGRDKLP